MLCIISTTASFALPSREMKSATKGTRGIFILLRGGGGPARRGPSRPRHERSIWFDCPPPPGNHSEAPPRPACATVADGKKSPQHTTKKQPSPTNHDASFLVRQARSQPPVRSPPPPSLPPASPSPSRSPSRPPRRQTTRCRGERPRQIHASQVAHQRAGRPARRPHTPYARAVVRSGRRGDAGTWVGTSFPIKARIAGVRRTRPGRLMWLWV